MNERIKLLTEQADNYALNMNPEQDPYGRAANPNKFRQDRDTKFAELIVRECMEWCDAHATINGTAQQIRDSIKKDFGVEE